MVRKTGYMDEPRPGSVLEGTGPHTVQGWVYSPLEVTGIVVSVDGLPMAAAAVDIPRPDVVAVLGLPAHALRCGWSVSVDFGDLRVSPFEVSAAAWFTDGRVAPIATATVRIGPRLAHPVGHIDIPADGAVVAPGAMWICGWALFPDGPPATVELVIGDRAGRLARTGVPRPDLGTAYPGVGEIGGFEEILDTSAITPGTNLKISAVATAMDGRTLRLPTVNFTIGESPPPMEPAEAERAAALRQRTRRYISTAPVRQGMPIVVFTHQLDYGGGQLYLHEMLRRWTAEPGFFAAVVSPVDGVLRPELERLGVEVHVCGGYGVDGIDAYEGRQRELLAWAQPYGFRLAVVNTMVAFAGADAAARMGIPVVWGIHESFELTVYWELAYGRGGVHPYAKERALGALRDADLVAFEADATRRLYSPHVSHGVTLPYGVALDDIDRYIDSAARPDVRASLGLEPDDRVILCLGTIEPRKSQVALVQAFETVAARHPLTRLVFVGDNGTPSALALRDLTRRSPFAHRIRLLPVAAEIFPWYVSADLFVSASDIESLPRSVLEAMAFGVPVLAVGVFGLPELIKDGESGFLCPPRDTRALASALDTVLSLGPDALLEVARAGAATVRAQHDSTVCAAEYWRRMQAMVVRP